MGCIPLVVKRKNCIKNHFCISRFNEIRPNYLELVPFNFEATSPFQIQQYKQNILVNNQNYQNVFILKFNNLLFQLKKILNQMIGQFCSNIFMKSPSHSGQS